MSDTTVNGLTIRDYGEQVDSDEAKARKDLESRYGKVWDTDELRKEFVVLGFCAPCVGAERLEDGARGSLEFTHSPRFYHSFVADRVR
jgi:hypothetical protein